MSIQKISKEQLRRMGDQEGLVLQGCGGDPQEWLDGINEILTNEGILKKGAGFEEAYTFQHDGLTCLLFPFKENMELDMGKLAVWRLATHSTFGGTWLSDYVPNRLGGFVQIQEQKEPDCVKPDCPLIGTDGNIFHLMGIASGTLRKNGMQEQAEEMRNRIFQCQSYDSALSIIGDYVNINFILPETGKPCLLFDKALRIMAGLIAEKRIAITLANSDQADVRVLYDSEENVIKDTYPIYHKQ